MFFDSFCRNLDKPDLMGMSHYSVKHLIESVHIVVVVVVRCVKALVRHTSDASQPTPLLWHTWAPNARAIAMTGSGEGRNERTVTHMGEQVELTKQVAVGRSVKILGQCPDSTPPSLSSTGPGTPSAPPPSISHGYPRKVRRR